MSILADYPRIDSLVEVPLWAVRSTVGMGVGIVEGAGAIVKLGSDTALSQMAQKNLAFAACLLPAMFGCALNSVNPEAVSDDDRDLGGRFNFAGLDELIATSTNSDNLLASQGAARLLHLVASVICLVARVGYFVIAVPAALAYVLSLGKLETLDYAMEGLQITGVFGDLFEHGLGMVNPEAALALAGSHPVNAL